MLLLTEGSILRIRLPLQRHKDPEVLPREELRPSRLPLGRNNAPVEQPFRLPLQRTDALEVLPKERLPSRLPLQRKHPEVLPKEQQPCKLPHKTQKDPQVLPREKQPCLLPLKRQKDQEVLPKEKKACLVSLQRNKDPEVLPREKQPNQLPLQRNKDPEVLPREKQPSQLPLQRNKDPAVLSREEQPLQKHKVPQVLPREDQPCSVSGRTSDGSVQGMCEPTPGLGRDEGEKPCSTSRHVGKEKRSSSRSSCRASQYRELIENWVEPPLLPSQLSTDIDDDQGWLLKANKNQNCGVEKRIAASDSLSCGDSVSWPRARLLPEVDMYALPFTVPF